MEPRSTRDVVERHISCRKERDLEADLTMNFAEDVVVLSAEGVNHGHDGVRRVADVLQRYLPQATYEIRDVLVEGRFALERWSASSEDRRAHDGTDSFVVENGLIVCQTIHYSVDGDRGHGSS